MNETHDFAAVLFPLLLLGTPLLGLILGAILPPFLYRKQIALAIVLNVAGFLIYILPALFISLLICADNFKAPRPGENTATLCLALGVFAGAEVLCFLLRRCLRRQHPIAPHEH